MMLNETFCGETPWGRYYWNRTNSRYRVVLNKAIQVEAREDMDEVGELVEAKEVWTSHLVGVVMLIGGHDAVDPDNPVMVGEGGQMYML